MGRRGQQIRTGGMDMKQFDVYMVNLDPTVRAKM